MTQPPPKLRERGLRLRSSRARREERDELGFLRQPMVRWLAPSIFARTGLATLVSGLFGKFADKREAQIEPQGVFDYSGRSELWIDYLSDTADGFEPTYTMAYLLGKEELSPQGLSETLPRADVLLLGGDEVYPYASPEGYEDRFVGPFEAALPEAPASRPHIFAVPGNHDWYDGLTTFLRLFAQTGWVGGWRKRQRRSYFALKLPSRWWVWAIDIQLDTYLDKRQLDYFKAVAERQLERGDRVILLTAKPSWVKPTAGRLEPASWRYLAYFEQRMIREKGAQLELTLTGDLHHYSRYEPEEDPEEPVENGLPSRITAGGGGAYLYPTHVLPAEVPLKTWRSLPTVTYRAEKVYPDADQSKRFRWRGLLLPWTNPGFGLLAAGLYVVLAWTMLGALDTPEGEVSEFRATVAGGATPAVTVLLILGLVGYADFGGVEHRALRWVGKSVVGILHAALHVGAVGATVFVLSAYLGGALGMVGLWLVAVPAVAAVGYVGGSLIYAGVLVFLHVVLGPRAPEHANEVFASQGIKDYKNFLRLHVGRDGRLTVYPLGVDHVPRAWQYQGRSTKDPWFKPVDREAEVRLIDGPLEYPRPVAPSAGDRVVSGSALDTQRRTAT